MQSRLVYRYVDSVFINSGESLYLPEALRADIDRHWSALMRAGEPCTNGRIYAVSRLERAGGKLRFILAETNYAHYLYTLVHPEIGEYRCRSVATSCILQTTDGYYGMAEASRKTAHAGRIVFVGGALDAADCVNGVFDLQRGLRREVEEETGLSAHIVSAHPVWTLTREGMRGLNVSHIARLDLNREECRAAFERHNEPLVRRDEQEQDALVFLKCDAAEVRAFADDPSKAMVPYLGDTLRVLTGALEPGDLLQALRAAGYRF